MKVQGSLYDLEKIIQESGKNLIDQFTIKGGRNEIELNNIAFWR